MTTQERRLVDLLILKFRGSSSQFEEGLKREYPQLTGNDLRLCNYIKANLSTKEIATVLNITPDSVKKAKHRLRKKLVLGPDKRLLDALSVY